MESRKAALVDTFICLHLLREEQRLDTTAAETFSTGGANLSSILSQIARWLGWESWVQHYEFEDASLLDMDYDTGNFDRLRFISDANTSDQTLRSTQRWFDHLSVRRFMIGYRIA